MGARACCAAADPCRYCVMIPDLLILAQISPATLFITYNRIELLLIDGSLIEIGSGWLVPVPCLKPEVTEDVYCPSRHCTCGHRQSVGDVAPLTGSWDYE